MATLGSYADDTTTADDDKFLTYASDGSTKLSPASNINKYVGPGWTIAGDTWSFSSWSSTTKIGVLNTNSGATTRYSPGMWIRFTQTTLGTKYAKIVSVATSTVSALFVNSTQLDNEAVSAPSYSVASTPFGIDNTGTWLSYTSVWQGSSNPAIGNGTFTARYRVDGKTVIVNICITMGSTTTYGTGEWNWTLPVAPSTASKFYTGSAWALDAGTNYYGAISKITSSSATISLHNSAASGTGWGPSNPFTWGNTDELAITITYQAA